MVKNIVCPSKLLEFDSQCPHGSSQVCVTPVPREIIFFLASTDPGHTGGTQNTCRETLIHKN